MCESESHSVMSHCLHPHGLYSQWNSPGQNTGVGSLSLLQGTFPNQMCGMCANVWNPEKWFKSAYLQGRNRDTDKENRCVDNRYLVESLCIEQGAQVVAL